MTSRGQRPPPQKLPPFGTHLPSEFSLPSVWGGGGERAGMDIFWNYTLSKTPSPILVFKFKSARIWNHLETTFLMLRDQTHRKNYVQLTARAVRGKPWASFSSGSIMPSLTASSRFSSAMIG